MKGTMSKQSKKIVGLENGDVSVVNFLNKMNVDLEAKEHLDYKYKSKGFMDLSIEAWKDPDNQSNFNVMVVSMAHWGEQNGDLMRDPEVVFKVYQMGDDVHGVPIYHVSMVSYRNDYVGVFQESTKYVDGQYMVSKRLQKEQKSFLLQWIRNIKAQGHERVLEIKV